MKKDIKHICYNVAMDDLVQTWVEIYHRDENILVVHDAKSHLEYLQNLGFNIIPDLVYDNKILTVQFNSLEEALIVNEIMALDDGPYVQVWSQSQLITDNIEKFITDNIEK